jgi:hypothetical protein
MRDARSSLQSLTHAHRLSQWKLAHMGIGPEPEKTMQSPVLLDPGVQ